VDVRSYRRVFVLERRIYRVDRLRLNPSGVPLRGVVYFLALAAATSLTARLPGAGAIVGALPWYVRDLALPGVIAALLAVVQIDGRPFHLAARAVVRFRARPRTHARVCFGGGRAGVWLPPPLLMIPDGSEPRIRRFRYTGPGVARLPAAHQRHARGALARVVSREHVIVRAGTRAAARTSGDLIVLGEGARLRTGSPCVRR
jgi:hypothetical protein